MNTLYANEIVGNWATLLLATNNSGDIDYSRLNDEIDVLIASHPNGIYSNGTAGEFYSQSEDEFYKISELLSVKCHKANVPFQIGVSHMSPNVSRERLKMVKSLTPSAVQVVLPDWFPVTIEEAIAFLKEMEATAEGVNLVLYNPPHAKRVLSPSDWSVLKENIPTLQGVKVFDNNLDKAWYESMRENSKELSVFVPGHHLVSGVLMGASGAYSNVACINPVTAQKWYNSIEEDREFALDLERRINIFMDDCIAPFITKHRYPNHACDRFMAMVGGWADVGSKLRWPYRSIPDEFIVPVREKAKSLIPEFFANN